MATAREALTPTAVQPMRVREIGGGALAQMSTSAAITMAEVDKQISTAHAYPRDITTFRQEALELVTLNQSIADECIYALPRGGKVIEGPSARFAEIIASCWGNSRAGARVMAEERNFIVAQGVFHDLQRNVAINYEVKRRITDREGGRYNDDMISVTANAACSIALRNAVLKGVPKAFWSDIYEAAKKVAEGSAQTLEKRRMDWITIFEKQGITRAQIFKTLNVKGLPDIGLEQLVILKGIQNAVKNGEYTVEQAFSAQGVPAPGDPEDAAQHEISEAEAAQLTKVKELCQELGHTEGNMNMLIGQYQDHIDALIEKLTSDVEAKRKYEREEVEKGAAKPVAETAKQKSGKGGKALF
jgi:hypothetical protein